MFFNMRCREAEELIPAAVDGELSPRRRQALDRHVASCPACRAELGSTQILFGALGRLAPDAIVPARLEQDTLRRVRLAAAEETEGRRKRAWATWAIPALAAATAVMLMVVLGRDQEVPLAPPVPGAHGAPARTASAPMAKSARPQPTVGLARAQKPEVVPDPPAEPPPALAAAPDLYMDLPVLRHMEKLEHFEAIETTTLDDAPAVPGDGEHTSG